MSDKSRAAIRAREAGKRAPVVPVAKKQAKKLDDSLKAAQRHVNAEARKIDG